jgi:hypothetical protein
MGAERYLRPARTRDEVILVTEGEIRELTEVKRDGAGGIICDVDVVCILKRNLEENAMAITRADADTLIFNLHAGSPPRETQ